MSMATRDCTVCGESWDDSRREFGTAVISPCPGHNIVRRVAPPFTSFELMRSKLADTARRTPPNRQRLDPFASSSVANPQDQKENHFNVKPLELPEEHVQPPALQSSSSALVEMVSPTASESHEQKSESSTKPPSPLPTFNFQLPAPSVSAAATASAPQGGSRSNSPILSQPLPNVVPPDFPLVNNPPTSIPHDTLPNSNLLSKSLPSSAVKEKKKKSSLDKHWNCGGIACSLRCIGHAIAGLWSKNGWFKTWWGALGNKKYLTREEFELSLNSYAELLRLVDFYIVQRETGKIKTRDLKKHARQHKKKVEDVPLSSQDMRERQDQYMEALIVGPSLISFRDFRKCAICIVDISLGCM